MCIYKYCDLEETAYLAAASEVSVIDIYSAFSEDEFLNISRNAETEILVGNGILTHFYL